MTPTWCFRTFFFGSPSVFPCHRGHRTRFPGSARMAWFSHKKKNMTPLLTPPTTQQHNQSSRRTPPHYTIQAHLPSTRHSTASTHYSLAMSSVPETPAPATLAPAKTAPAPAPSLPAPPSGSSLANALLVGAAAASSATTTPVLGTAA